MHRFWREGVIEDDVCEKNFLTKFLKKAMNHQPAGGDEIWYEFLLVRMLAWTFKYQG